jgi:hypothetical protein
VSSSGWWLQKRRFWLQLTWNARPLQRGRGERIGSVAPKPTAAELLETPGAVLTSSHLKELGWTRTHIDAIWRSCPMVILTGARRPVLRVEDYLAYLEEHTFRNEQPRVRPPFEPLAGPSPTELASQRRRRAG